MLRKLTFALAAAIAVCCAAFVSPVLAQSNAGTGNQGAISSKPKIEVLQRDITDYREHTITTIRGNADNLNTLAGKINEKVIEVKKLIESFTGGNERDPYVASFADSRAHACFAGCGPNQKMRWDGNAWACLSASLPTCPSGRVFSAATCTCENPCQPITVTLPAPNGTVTYPQVPDSAGTCCVQAKINPQTGLCKVCPDHSQWDYMENRCRCTAGGTSVEPGGTCPACGSPNALDTNGECCLPTQMTGGLCPGACPTPGYQRDRNGLCCAPATMVNNTCPVVQGCPAGTTVVQGSSPRRCICPNGQVISQNGTCTVCGAGQLPDMNGQCCDEGSLSNGVGSICLGGQTTLTCAASTINGCDLSATNLPAGQSTKLVTGTCASGQAPATGNSCNATCQAAANGQSASYGSPSVGCIPSNTPPLNCPVATVDYCQLPASTVLPGGTATVNGTCPAGREPAGGNATCYATCQGNANNQTTSYVSPKAGCVCASGMVQGSGGACVCPANTEMFNGNCIPIITVRAGCFVDTTDRDRFNDGQCAGSGPTSTHEVKFQVGDMITQLPSGDDWVRWSPQAAGRFTVRWSNNCTEGDVDGTVCTVRNTSSGVIRRSVTVIDNLKGETIPFGTIEADKMTCTVLPTGGCSSSGGL